MKLGKLILTAVELAPVIAPKLARHMPLIGAGLLIGREIAKFARKRRSEP